MNLSNIITTILSDPDVLKPIVEAVDNSLLQRVVALEEAVAHLGRTKFEGLEERLATGDFLTLIINKRTNVGHLVGRVRELENRISELVSKDITDLDRTVRDVVQDTLRSDWEIEAEDITGLEQAIKDALEDITVKLRVD